MRLKDQQLQQFVFYFGQLRGFRPDDGDFQSHIRGQLAENLADRYQCVVGDFVEGQRLPVFDYDRSCESKRVKQISAVDKCAFRHSPFAVLEMSDE